ncbi:LysM peptidoglycan-binding domain-containing protein [Thalassobacillus hwangdonensis]|uniref:LysM peptidoglycan-binding domain-containing protein n=1 Tax=Thalassobacillus hwangdonensis TaxID=546108 RepID=A0ABW3KZ25_9BACI
MTNDNKNVFSFYLDEALWFERGQEVKELMGISLEPEIAIQPFEETVLVKGMIELSGEYFALDPDEASAYDTVTPFPSRKTIDQVERSAEGASQFSHKFPVEVSIPRNRVNDLDEVSVSIDAFDYELPSAGQLKLHATVAIHGIQGLEDEVQAAVVETSEPVRNEQWDAPQTFEVNYSPETFESSSVSSSIAGEAKEESSSDRWKYTKVQSFQEFFHHEQAEESSSEMSTSDYVQEETVEEMESSPSSERTAGNRLLFNIFSERETAESYTKMKLCIVQEEDTLDGLAEKYQVTRHTLSKVNNVEEEDLTPGKIIYIPQS